MKCTMCGRNDPIGLTTVCKECAKFLKPSSKEHDEDKLYEEEYSRRELKIKKLMEEK